MNTITVIIRKYFSQICTKFISRSFLQIQCDQSTVFLLFHRSKNLTQRYIFSIRIHGNIT